MACATCVPTSCGSEAEDVSLFPKLLDPLRDEHLWKEDGELSDEGSESLNAMAMFLSKEIVSSMRPLVETFHALGLDEFVKLAKRLHEQRIIGHLIAWAFDYCERDIIKFNKLVLEKDSGLINHVNKEARIFEAFNPLETVPKAVIRRKPCSQSQPKSPGTGESVLDEAEHEPKREPKREPERTAQRLRETNKSKEQQEKSRVPRKSQSWLHQNRQYLGLLFGVLLLTGSVWLSVTLSAWVVREEEAVPCGR